MQRCHSALFLACFVFLSTETKKLEDYCWRDYDGTIPPDALQVDQGGNNKIPVYVGQVLFQEKIIPGKIHENDTKIYFEYFDVEYSTDANAKILCTSQPSKFQWIPIRNTDVLTLPSESLVKGGFEPKCQSFVGRVEISGELLPGKVICCQGVTDCYGLYTTKNGKGSLHSSFQILRYNENLPSRATTTIIDTRNKDDVEPQNGKCKNIVINFFN